MAASLRVLPRKFTVASFSSFGKTFHQKLLEVCLQARALHSCGSGHQSWLVRRSWVTGMIQIDTSVRWTWSGTYLLFVCFFSLFFPFPNSSTLFYERESNGKRIISLRVTFNMKQIVAVHLDTVSLCLMYF